MAGLEKIQRSGAVDMFDAPSVVNLCIRLGFDETADWICQNKRKYSEGVLYRGFKSKKQEVDE
jgi:hypothetical protein